MRYRRRTSGSLSLCFVIGAAIAGLSVSQAGVIGSMSITNWGLVIGRGVLPSELNLRFTVSTGTDVCWTPSPTCYVLLDRVLTPADLGGTFAITAASNANFAAVASTLTDGADNMWGFSRLPNPGGGLGSLVSRSFPTGGGPDFKGFGVAEIDLTVDRLIFQQVMLPINLTTFDTFTEARGDFTISVRDSAVPENAPAALVGAGMIGLALAGRLRSRRRRC